MIRRQVVVLVVAGVLVAVAAGAGYLFLTQGQSAVPPGPPTVASTSPAASAAGVAVSSKVSVTFNKAMDPTSITASTFTLKRGATSVPGTVSYAGLTATFTPSSALAALTAHTATVTTGAKDASGHALASNFVWGFTTAQVADTTPPRVAFTSPSNAAMAVPTNTKVVATFSKAMDPATVTTTTFTLKLGTASVAGTVSYAGTTATFAPANSLATGSAYSASVTTGAKDTAGRPLAANFVWGFSTGQGADTTPPSVSSTSPAVSVAVNSNVWVTFSEPMDPSSISASTFTVKQGATNVQGTVTLLGQTATFDPVSNLAPGVTYSATVTTGARDLAGIALPSPFQWAFTTAATANACAQLTVNLGSAAGFAIVAGSTVTNTGSSTVTGDLALSPGSEVIGFPPGTLVGTQHVADTAAASAMNDLTIAFNDAAGRTLCPVSVAGNLGGMTLAPGLYKSTSGLEVTSGDLTLDAQGDSNAVFIFQMASTLTTTEGRFVILAGGAKASNVFWQVGTSATLGVNSSFVGTIMADQSVSLDTGATLDGRALARIGAVTLDAGTISRPAA